MAATVTWGLTAQAEPPVTPPAEPPPIGKPFIPVVVVQPLVDVALGPDVLNRKDEGVLLQDLANPVQWLAVSVFVALLPAGEPVLETVVLQVEQGGSKNVQKLKLRGPYDTERAPFFVPVKEECTPITITASAGKRVRRVRVEVKCTEGR